MKYEIFIGDSFKIKERKEPEVTIRLIHADNGGLNVAVVDDAGIPLTGGLILTFTKEGYIKFQADINDSLGFPLDDDGELMGE